MAPSPFSVAVTPDGEGFEDCLRRRGTPRRTRCIELGVDREIQDAVCSRYGLLDGLSPSDPFFPVKKEIAIQRFLGYDYVRCGLEGVRWPLHWGKAEDTAALGRAGGREFMDEHRGPVCSWEDFEKYPWPDFSKAGLRNLEWLERNLPDDMCLLSGGVGHYAELLSWLMGYETLCFALHDDRALVMAVFSKVDALCRKELALYLQFPRIRGIWGSDDMGFRGGLLMSPADTRQFALSGHREMARRTHGAGKLYLLHSCGNLSAIRNELIGGVGIDAKHSFEDTIESVIDAKRSYGDRVALLGGIDVDFLCRATEAEVRRRVGETCRACLPGGGWCLGTGNTVANYVPLDSYLAMLDEGRKATA